MMKHAIEWIVAGFILVGFLRLACQDFVREWKAKWEICPHCGSSHKVYQDEKQ